MIVPGWFDRRLGTFDSLETHREEGVVDVRGIEVPDDPDVFASLVTLLEIEVLEDGQAVSRLPPQMAMFERDLFDRTAKVLASLGGVLDREVGGFLFPSSVDIFQFIEKLLEQDLVMADVLLVQGLDELER